jgi:hypothetical protein
MAGALSQGSTVTLLFAPLQPSLTPPSIDRVLVLDVRRSDGGTWLIIVATRRVPSTSQARAILERRVVVVKT